MRTFSILLILLSLNTLTACGESKQDKIANLERKIKVASEETADCLRKVPAKDWNEESCKTERQQLKNLEEEYKKLVKSS